MFVKYMLMYLTFSNLNSIHWLIKKKKDIGLNVLFRTFSGHFMTIFMLLSTLTCFTGISTGS